MKNSKPDKFVLLHCGELVSLSPLAKANKRFGIEDDDLGIIKNAWLLAEGGKVVGFGPMEGLPEIGEDYRRIDANHRLVSPGLIDSHTHPLFAGNRSHEFAMVLEGKTYQDIAKAGGGIQSTMRATRQASQDDLQRVGLKHLKSFLHWGVTGVEVKTGYGLTTHDELRQLEVLKSIQKLSPQTIYRTCLALHALPPEYPDTPSYIAALLGEGLVQQIADNDLADAFDAFVETGYFAAEDLEGFITEVRSHGFDIRLHADEFSDSGGAAAAARWGAKSADHLQHASQSGIKAMAEKGVIATLLPGTSLYSKIPYTQAAPLINAHCPIAIASDFNPGSCRLGNLPLVTSMAALHCGLSRSLAFAGITYLASCSLGWEGSKGSLHIGYDADFIIHEVGSLNEWFADFGQTSPREVWIQGSPALVTESQ